MTPRRLLWLSGGIGCSWTPLRSLEVSDCNERLKWLVVSGYSLAPGQWGMLGGLGINWLLWLSAFVKWQLRRADDHKE
jgi:hypothetical protein